MDRSGELFLKDNKTGEQYKLGETSGFEVHEEPLDQWNHGGDCKFCRRKNYCGKPCKAAKERGSKILYGLVAKTMIDVMNRKK